MIFGPVGLRCVPVVAVISVLGTAVLGAPPVVASVSVRTTPCTTIPALVNGGFEDFSNPDDGGVANNKPTVNGYGWWHGYPYGGSGVEPGPDQILFLKSGDASVPSNYLTGWRTTDPNQMVEVQRQVSTYSESVGESGTVYGPYSPARSGTATPTTYLESGYWDKYGPQPAEGSYWAELNALTSSALYQDVSVVTGDQMFWSLKHRGRTENPEQMRVMIGPAGGALAQQTAIVKYAPTNADVFVGYPTYNATSTTVSQIVTPLNSGWNRYEGAYTASATGSLRFQFEAVGGTPFGNAFGNLLDDIQFTVFLACPATRTLQVGESVSIDVGTAPMSYGIRQSLVSVSNSTAPAGEIQSSGNTVTFTPSSAGTFTANYTMEMVFGGVTYTRSAQLTYVVSAAPAPPTPPTPTQPEPTPQQTSPAPTAPVAMGEPRIAGQVFPGGTVTCTAPSFEPDPNEVEASITLAGTSLSDPGSGRTPISARIPTSAVPGQSIECTVRAAVGSASTIVSSTATIYPAPSECRPASRTGIVAFRQLDSSLDRQAKGRLRALDVLGCQLRVIGFVEPTQRTGNDGSLSRARAVSVASYLRRLGADVTSVVAGRRSIQAACAASDNRCVIVRVAG